MKCQKCQLRLILDAEDSEMTTPLIIDTILLLGIFIGALFTGRYLLGAGASFLLVSFEIFTTKQGGAETYFQGLAVLLITILIVSDGKKKEKGSLLYRYSSYNDKSKLPSWLRIALLIVLGFAFIARALISIFGLL